MAIVTTGGSRFAPEIEMPTTRSLVELFRAIAAEDVAAAESIAAEICAKEEQKGHRTAARSLRGALHKCGHSPKSGPPFPDSRTQHVAGLLSTGLVKLSTERSLDEVMLAPAARAELMSVIAEWEMREALSKRNLSPRAKLLFHGPPGCGKSLTAKSLAFELGLPIYLVRFDSIIGAYLGQTAIHLRQLFYFAESMPCVLLLDELDALGKRRGNPLDVGELDRIVIALMQELEHSKPLGPIVATSNLASNLDDALWRRFDLSLEFKSPSKRQLATFCKKVAKQYQIRLPRKIALRAAGVRSFAEAEAVVTAEARHQALSGK